MESKLMRLSEIEDWELYAKGLEAHLDYLHIKICAWKDVDGEIGGLAGEERWARGDMTNAGVQLICLLEGQLNAVLQQIGDRRRRLRDRAVWFP